MVGERLGNQKPEFGPFTFAALHDAFELVRDPQDWKAPINAIISESVADVVYHAIMFSQAESRSSFGHPESRTNCSFTPTATGSILAHNSLDFPGRQGLSNQDQTMPERGRRENIGRRNATGQAGSRRQLRVYSPRSDLHGSQVEAELSCPGSEQRPNPSPERERLQD